LQVVLHGIYSYDSTQNKKYSYFWSLLNFPPMLMCGGITGLTGDRVTESAASLYEFSTSRDHTDDDEVPLLRTRASCRHVHFCLSV